MSAGPIMIMAGGTGGHVFPGLAVAAELKARQREVVWLGTQRGLEARLELSEALSLGASLQGVLLTPRPVVAVDSASEELGQPLLLATLGLGVAF